MTQYYRRHLDDRQVHRRWIDPRLYSVRVADVQAYLRHKGWKLVQPDAPGELEFQEPGEPPDGPLYQWVPENEQGRDYPQRLYELLAAIAEVEDRYAGDVLSDILRRPGGGAFANGPSKDREAEIGSQASP
jgi:hypothetical protein